MFVKYIEQQKDKDQNIYFYKPKHENQILLSSTVAILLVHNRTYMLAQLIYIWSSLILPAATHSTERDVDAEARHQFQIDPLRRLFCSCACRACCRPRTACCCAEQVWMLQSQVSS